MDWIQAERMLDFDNYAELWEWSVENVADFWQSIADYFEVIFHNPPNRVMSDDPMPHTRWFQGASLNYAEHIFRAKNERHPAIIFQSERHGLQSYDWAWLEKETAAMRAYLQHIGLKRGDSVAAFLPNVPQATVAFLATCSLGAVWSSCSPDFGVNSVADRFSQIEPKVLFAVDGYQYGGKAHNKSEAVSELCEKLPTVQTVVYLPYLNDAAQAAEVSNGVLWSDALAHFPDAEMAFDAVPFEHPIWVLYSSGTTGIPKAITHSHGGVLLEHYKYLAFHNDVHAGERFFWFSTTGWMMWNFVQAALLVGSSIVLYDGSPGYPGLEVLWRLSEKAKINHFGTSAPFLVACMKRGLSPHQKYDLSALRSIGSTGAPLPPEAFDWVYENIKPDVWLCSMSGGTDVCTAFVGGCPMEPVYMGEIQCRALGCGMHAFNELGEPLIDEMGEMVVTKPMPSMPVYFWNDPDKKRYKASYFEMYPNIWRHGDWLKITNRGTLVIYGRSDATLNRQGVRIGTAEIYRSLNKITEIADALIVNLELSNGSHYMPLFVVPAKGETLNNDLKNRIKQALRSDCSPRHVPR